MFKFNLESIANKLQGKESDEKGNGSSNAEIGINLENNDNSAETKKVLDNTILLDEEKLQWTTEEIQEAKNRFTDELKSQLPEGIENKGYNDRMKIVEEIESKL